ncbi:hydrocephalus-inducing protein homolog isoform X2 [Anneissia japonica]|uniref:hydrocephalus-inducing protein homolog isoform X2 n=1 Tax=Anneissia japonica TaxID=1529436 RepID=UPI0014259867|nr:hydrocephalus-inducing protein homolog isoform X2 [Anneissia japonica]
MPTGLEKQTAKRATDCGDTPLYDSKVVAPRNPKLVRGDPETEKLTPSSFMREMAQSTHEKLANTHDMRIPQVVELLDMGDTTYQMVSEVDIDEPMFQPFPSEITFLNYEPFEVYEVPLVLRNNDKVPRLVKVVQADSPYFKVISPHDVSHKVAPGIPTIFKVQFIPEEKKDYMHELVCITEREKFIVPVKAIGARAILDFPDDVTFPTSPVKFPSTKMLLVRNIGNREAKFSLNTERPFFVNPEKGILPVGESMQIELTFKPLKVGDHSRNLIISYETNEKVYINLYGCASDANVRLDKSSVRIENTFISMANQRAVTISNRSNVIVHYQWKPFATLEEEMQQKERFCQDLESEEAMDHDKFLAECISDPTVRDKMAILTQTFSNRRKLIETDSMLFSDDVFVIEPSEGDIWPNSTAEVNVVFKPQEAAVYSRTAYCDITGRESRLPLRIRGDGIGPKLIFSFDTLDMGHIFIGSTHTYEVVLSNTGDIDASFQKLSSQTTFGPCFKFQPSEGLIRPGGHQAVLLSFCSVLLGDFDEVFEFFVDGSPSQLQLQFKGCVIGPTFHFDVPRLKFGTISYGFTNIQCATLVNTALVPMNFVLRVPGDGTDDTVCATSGEVTLGKTGHSKFPKEFTITPDHGTIDPQSELKIQIQLISNTLKKYDMAMVVDVEKVGSEILSLPIIAKCVVPPVVIVSPILDYTRCFLDYPYEQSVQLFNDSDLPAKYDLVPQVIGDLSTILYTSPEPTGIIQPHSVIDIPLVITPQGLEELEAVAEFSIFGSSELPLQVQLICIGEGPVVHVTPHEIDWGQTQVLTDVTRTVELSNESLIPAEFTCSLVRPNSLWKVEPASGVIPPEEALEIKVTVNLDDCIKFHDKLAISFVNSQVHVVKLHAVGFGTTIVSNPPMTPSINLGHHFSNRSCKRMFTLTNKGRRHQQMFWSTEGFPHIKTKNKDAFYNPKDVKYQRMPPPPPPPRPVFTLTPSRFELDPGQSIEVVLDGQSDETKLVKERLVCHAIIGKSSGKEKIMKTDISINFISPLLEFSSKQVCFRVDKHPDDVLEKQVGELEFSNVSSLPLTTLVSLEYPFQLVNENGDEVASMEIPVGVGEIYKLTLQFDPAYEEDSVSRVAEKVLTISYLEHPHIDYISLRGEVFFPNLTFEKMTVDFGCILNDTEVTRYVNITNDSPMPVRYRWSFLEPEQPIVLYPQPIPQEQIEEEMMEDNPLLDQPPIIMEELLHDDAENVTEKGEQCNTEDLLTQTDNTEYEQKDLILPPGEMEDKVEKKEEKKDHEKKEKDNEQHEKKKGSRKSPRKSTSKSGSKSGKSSKLTVDKKDAEKDEVISTVVEPSQETVETLTDEKTLPERIPSSRLSIRPASVARKRKAKLAYIQTITEPTVVGIEEVFDILPLYGCLMPGDSDTVTFTFYGHTDIGSEAKALCDVEGGPQYELSLKGEASLVCYSFDSKEIDFGKRMFDQVNEADIVLRNTGKVGFDFNAINMDPAFIKRPSPGVPVMIPNSGHIEAHSEQRLTIKFLPGIPVKFHKSFEIQVAHFEPDCINLYGEGVFPRVSFDLPRYGDIEGKYDELLKEAKENLGRDVKKCDKNERPATPQQTVTPRDPAQEDAKSICSMQLQSEFPSELELQIEVERLMVKEFSLDQQQNIQNREPVPPASTQEARNGPTPRTGLTTSLTNRSKRAKKPKARLPDYILDFGYVVLGTVRTHIVRATNTGHFPVSFAVDRSTLNMTGFNVELDRVKQLPGAPDHETVDFRVSFDPRGGNVNLGVVEALVPIMIVNGPSVLLRLKANVTMPDMQISTDSMDFGEVQCGQCKVITVQLHNNQHVRCEWSSLPSDKDKKKIDKHVPMHLRRKMKPEKPKPRNFEMMPSTGMLFPGQRLNVQVKFMPTEEKIYAERIVIRLARSSQRITLMANGVGLEPRLEFGQTLIEFGPILPHSQGDEVDVIVKNPCGFPIEFYSLEFDKQYLEEEKILRLMKGYDEYGTILLPPRDAGDKLPQELLEYFEEQKKKVEEEEQKEKEEAEAAAAAAAAAAETAAKQEGEEATAATSEKRLSFDGVALGQGSIMVGSGPHLATDQEKKAVVKEGELTEGEKLMELKEQIPQGENKKDDVSSLGVGELQEITPVSAAIARHLGIDLSPDGKAAMRRRGVAIVVHGAPLSGKTSTAITLAKYYEAALLTIDGVVLEAISNCNSIPGQKARELCSQAAKAQLIKEGEGNEAQGMTAAGGLSVEAVTAHAMGTGSGSVSVGGAHSVISNRKTSTISGHKPAHSTQLESYEKPGRRDRKQEVDNATQISSSPTPAAPIARRLSVSASVAGEEGLMSCVLPDELLVEILAERLQLNDCHRGIVFDGLETLFSPNQPATASALLKAFNNRKYIYFITLKLEQAVLQAREKKEKEEKELLEKQQEEEEKQRLEEMSEEEYDALDEEEKAAIDLKRLKAKKERLLKKEMEERLERERKEKELAALIELQKLEDEKNKKKKGAKQQEKDGGKAIAGKRITDSKMLTTGSVVGMKVKSDGKHDPSITSSDHAIKMTQSIAMERPESHGTAGSETQGEETGKKKRKDKRPISNEIVPEPEVEKDPAKEAELLLANRFKAFEHSFKDIDKLLDRWDRTIGQICLDPNADDADADETPVHPPSGRKGRGKIDKEKEKERERERLEKERLEKEKAEKEKAAEDGDEDGEENNKDEVGVCHILMDVSDETDDQIGDRILQQSKLPAMAEVMDGLGLGPNGPPIPPSASFSVVPYPVKRRPPMGGDANGHYVFVASSPDDPNVSIEDKPKELEPDIELGTPERSFKDRDDHTSLGKTKGKDKVRAGAESSSSRRRSAKSRNRKGSLTVTSPPPGSTTPGSDADGQSSTGDLSAIHEPKYPRLSIFRWMIQPGGEVTLRLRFQSEELGQFDQTLNFEITGTRRRYQLFNRGICSFPNISREPRIVFPNRKKSKRTDEIVHKKYILSTETLMMGPLLAGKSRDRYKEGKYPENTEKLKISNTSPLDVEVSFCFQYDSNATTFLLDPPSMSLKPGDAQELSIWVYPKNQGYFEDSIVCCIRENPEPVMFKVACYGVRPELELDKKQLHFERVLLHRKDNKTIYLRNSTLLPVSWRLSGLENLGDDFSVTTDSGVIEPKSEFALNANFRAMKPITLKKTIRLEVSDAENIMGLLQTENIQVLAEAYDVALDMSFPKGADGGLDFGVIKVLDETKQTCSLKNKGRYDIAFNFVLEPTSTCGPEQLSLFSVIPQKGVLIPNDRPTSVQVIFKSRKEITIKDQQILKCHVIEPSVTEGGETIASIPVKLSVRSIFSKYNIYPVNDINFGAVLTNTRKQRSFTIENKGEFDFKYFITKMQKNASSQQPVIRGRVPPGGKRSKSRDDSSSGRSVIRPKRADSMRQDMGGGNPSRLQLGMFTVYPAYGMVAPGNQVVIQVDCLAESEGKGDEDIAIDIHDRDPAQSPQGIPYKLLAEACSPGINVVDITSVFEEHRICKNLSVFLNNHQLDMESGGVYGEDENRFLFGNVLVGRRSKARFKIMNRNKISCDVVFTCKLNSSKVSSKLQDIFEVEPNRACIPAHSHVYAEVTFSPPSMQTYTGSFEVVVDGLSGSQAKQKNLGFEVQGEGNLPRITVSKPSIRNKKGSPVLLFSQILINRTQSLPFSLKNEGTLPSKVDIDLNSSDGGFILKAHSDTKLIHPMASDYNPEFDEEVPVKRPHTASVIIGVDECANFDVVFKPSEPTRCTGTIRVSVMDNQYEDTIVQLVGEGYQDEITLDNIHSFIDDSDIENLVGAEEVMAAPSNLIHFRDCHIGEPRQLTFTMTNHSEADTVRFQWPDHPQLKFLPTVGHLHAGCAKDISITFKTDEPVTLQNEAINAKISKITFDKPIDQVADWDDRLRTVKWVDITMASTRPSTNDATNRPKSTQDIKKEEKEKEGKHKRGAAAAAAAAAAAQEQMEKERCEEEMMKKTKEMMETPRPSKKKVIETEPEPTHVIMDDSNRDIELRVSVNADFAKFKCKPDVINFKDTLMFQTRVYTFFIANKGSIQLDYSWQVVMEELAQRKSVSFADEEQLRLPSRCSTSIMSDVPDIFPFTIMPDVGTIPAGKKQNFNIMFSPLDVQEHEGRLICRIPNLEPGKQGPVIAVHGKSVMPYCHFELEDSDYITSARRNPELRGPGGAPPGATLDPNTRVIEFNSTGVNVKNPRNFYIVNPTSQGYSFLWTCEDEPDPKEPDVFHCLIPNGYINPGKKFEILFDFIPNKLDIVESFWRFTIPEQNISVPFLLVGNAREPAISMDRSHINFRSILLGNAAEETVYLANNEDKPFQFSIDETSCHSEGFSSFVTVTPMDGIIPPHRKLPINVHFVPREQKEVNFNLKVSIRKKTLPIQLNVKAEGYSMCATLLCEDSQGTKVELTSKGLNEINFGEIEVNEKAVRSLFIINTGKFNFDFEWILTSRKKSARYLLINPENGSVVCNDRKRCVLAFKPTSTMVLSGIELLLKVANGPTFPINVVGSGVAPSLHFSFIRHDFGPCFIHRAGMPTHTALLTITNKDNKDISLDCHYASTSFLEVHFSAQVLQPNQCCDVHLTFYPREATKYHETIAFEVNGLSRQNVEILGQGTEMRVEVANPKDKNLNLGALRIGQTVKKTIPIINKSPAPITFNVVITPFSQVLQQLPYVLNLSPSHSITLKPKGGTYNLDMLFTPKCRIPQFTEEVMLECEGLSQPLFVVNGSCQGIEITLDRDSIPFGAVSLRSSTKRKLLMYNTGDIGAAFKWNLEHFAPDFNISPVAGYISPGMTVSFEITFQPQELCQDVRYDKLRCTIEGSKPLKLVLTGMCVGCVPMKETLHFNTHVRVKETRSVNLHNRSNLRWNLKPVIEGEHWSGAESIIVDPQSSKPYEVTYRPLIMTHEGKKHTGAVFFALPDGNGLLYNLTGVSEPPKAAGNIQREVPSKTHYTELLSVSNWLKRPQRFKVYIEMIKPDKLDPATTLKGLDYIDVPGLAKRDYKLNFYCHKESSYAAKVVFKNDQTHEFQFYYITLKSLAPDIISTIEMITPVRLTTSKTIVMVNPLAVSVTFQTNCQASDIMLPTQLVIPPQSEGSLVFEYLPLKVGTTQGKLTLTSAELGLYQYNLALTATAAGPEKAVYFRAPLGGNHVQVARFINYAKMKAEYTCKIDSSEFHCDKAVTAAPGSAGGGTEVNLDVTFEPSRLGETRATLTVSSPLAGEYTFPLFGTCIAPKPQGPYTIKANSTASIPFRNVFPHSTAFTFQVDNPSFSCKTGDTIRGKKTHNIIVGFEGNQDGTKAPKMGKLVVTCPRSAGGASSVAWTYYVRGVTP